MAKRKRKGISKKTRFEVFKRDKFTCQYCGRAAPDVILQLDHIQPVSKDGEDSMLNYVTACKDCNAGKGARELDDDTAIKKQKRMLDELQERREQLEMMLEWQRGLLDLDQQQVDEAAELWKELVTGYHLNTRGLENLKRMIKKHGLAEVIAAMRVSTSQYLEIGSIDGEDKYTSESVEKAFDYISRICTLEKRSEGKPYLRELYYIRGIMRNRFSYVNEVYAIQLLERAYEAGYPTDALREFTLGSRNWSQWSRDIQALIREAHEEDNEE